MQQPFGIDVETSTSSSKSENDPEDELSQHDHEHVTVREIYESVGGIQSQLKKHNYKWFDLIVYLEEQLQKDDSPVQKPLFDAITAHEIWNWYVGTYSVIEDEKDRIARIVKWSNCLRIGVR